MNTDKIFKKKKRYSFLVSNATSELDEERNLRLFAAVRVKEKNGKKVIIASHTPLSTGVKIKNLIEETEYMLDNIASPVPLTHTHNVTEDGWTWHMYSDTSGITYLIICASSYPARVAHKCIEEFQQKFSIRFGVDSLKAKENALTKDFRPAFEALVHKYEIPDEHDAATNALSKIAEVKNVMHDNIKISMQNTVSLETVAHTTEKLETQAGVFKRSTVDMTKDLRWQRYKCTVIAAVTIVFGLAFVAGVTYVVIMNGRRRRRSDDDDY